MPTIYKTFKYKLKPTRAQVETFEQWIGVCRMIYNLAKETREYAWKAYGVSLSKFDLMKQVTEIRAEYDWISAVPQAATEDTIVRLDTAYQNFFSGRAHYPDWAKKGKYRSFTLRRSLKIEYGRIRLPKVGWVRFFKDRMPSGQVKTATVIRQLDGWYVSVVAEAEAYHYPASAHAIGIDMGVASLVTTSDGDFYENPRHFEALQRKLRVEQRSLARKKKGGSNWLKQKKRVSILHQKIARMRTDYLHKLSTRLIRDNQAIVIEDLKVANMSRSAKGSIEEPGKNVAAKSGLNRSIMDAGWGMFRTMLEYKARWYGRTLITVDAAYTSQTCSSCGHVSKDNRKTQAAFTCQACGYENHADVNAAINILNRANDALSELTCPVGESVSEESNKVKLKQDAN